MVPYNAGRLGLEDISTVEKWQDSLEKVGIGRNGRYGRLQQLLNENYGKITVEKGKEIMSDRYDMKTGKVISPEEPVGDLIAAYNPDWVMSGDVTPYKSNRRGEYVVKPGTTFSFVATPSTGEIWLAVGDVPPVQYTAGYKYMDLRKELRRNR
jgi:hypothetical protein